MPVRVWLVRLELSLLLPVHIAEFVRQGRIVQVEVTCYLVWRVHLVLGLVPQQQYRVLCVRHFNTLQQAIQSHVLCV